jgi:hypothetical protein
MTVTGEPASLHSRCLHLLGHRQSDDYGPYHGIYRAEIV